MSNSPPGPGPDLFFAGGECLTRYGVWVRRTDVDLEAATREIFTRNSIAKAVEGNGEALLREWEADTPRADYLTDEELGIGTGIIRTVPSLLLEKAVTNNFTFSEQLDNAAWAKTRLSIVPNVSFAAPDGKISADQLIEDTSVSSDRSVSRTLTGLGDNQPQGLSFYANAGARTLLFVQTQDKAGGLFNTWFDIAAGTVGTQAPEHTVRIFKTRSAPSWVRVEVVWNAQTGGSTTFIGVFMAEFDGQTIYTGDGVSDLFLWGLQDERNTPVVSSYIKTEGVILTRDRDEFQGSFPHPPQEQTQYIKYVSQGRINLARMFSIGSRSGDRTEVFTNSNGFLRYTHVTDGTSTDSQFSGGATEVAGDIVEVRTTLGSDGRPQIFQSLNGGAETAGNLGNTKTLVSAWSNQLASINGASDGSDSGVRKYLAIKVHRGTRDRAFMRAL